MDPTTSLILVIAPLLTEIFKIYNRKDSMKYQTELYDLTEDLRKESAKYPNCNDAKIMATLEKIKNLQPMVANEIDYIKSNANKPS